jgi:glutamine synthetase type III
LPSWKNGKTNGVEERFMRIFKEQAVYERGLHNAEEVRAAVAALVETYNAQWRLEKLGFMTPREARENLQPALAAWMLSCVQRTGASTSGIRAAQLPPKWGVG